MNMSCIRRGTHMQTRTRGMVLPTVLIMLLILSVASVVLVEQISTQTRMAGNSANTAMSLQVAEAVLQTATSAVLAGTYPETAYRANANGLYFFRASNYSKLIKVPWETTAGWATAISVPQINSTTDLTTSRLYMIEELPAVVSPGGSKQKAYRITARVIGQGGQGSVMLQTLYKL
jgi:Tfp pilus assembly protein PilX